MSIVRNAINSIQVGVEDFQSDDDRRSVSAVRNVYAGILLLYKEKLCLMSPSEDSELLIKKSIRPILNEAGQIKFEGTGRKTVDVASIRERFKSLGVKVDWSRFDEINELRNELEHYYTSQSPDTVREILSKSFLLIRDFLIEHLDLDPQGVLGEHCWSTFLAVNEVYTAEERACKATINKIACEYESISDGLRSLRCRECHSSLMEAPYDDEVFPSITLHCKSCGDEFGLRDELEECVRQSLGGEAIRNAMEGESPPYERCLECGRDTFVHEESCCVACGYEMEYTFCEVCDEALTLEEQFNEGKCSYCQYQWERIMEE
ncbi:hypothetical protein J6I90_09980 [Pseudidiomarina sp. 1APP75-32.1]|uniref:Uncharacterized protein n=1 Tax=Pseudidiomarina terrestris TaxID=2820060 RepID=A0AAW7R3Y1_9GAMM|nr:hypothetical protein [Pseudidiomarina sp. 1APP75-32.1]MDN7125209.1 hypothetical protein [Pseudidiomarina sp. 1APP75-32.1]